MTSVEMVSRADEHMAEVEEFLRSQLASDDPLMASVCRYALDSGGKRLRPALVMLCGRLLGAGTQDLLPAAAAVEMIHTATLLHDDIMDASPMRRGRLTVCRRWDPKVAVFAGDYILSRAFNLLSDYGRKDVMSVFSEVTTRLCEGEVLQASKRGDLEISVDDYLEIINCKTAHFLSSCCRVGGLVANADEPALDALSQYGKQIGLVFQMTDDLLDYVGDTRETGKDVGADFREGKYTLPVIVALQARDETSRRLVDVLAHGDCSNAAFTRVRSLVIRSGALDRARAAADKCTEAAVESLNSLPDGGEREALRRLAQWIASRTA
ncbi:MAG TPA: polyprenyl synthetase family protein [Armatimonadota bacterium]|jgi:geranylgeranyl pyrophosphate synthase